MTDTASLSSLISAAVAAKMTPEFIEDQVNTRVGKLVVDSVDQALRSYSDTGEQIKKAVEDALRVDRLDLPSYGNVVTAMLKRQVEATVSELVEGRLAQDMAELLKLAPKEIKLSEIADLMRKRWKAYNGHDDAWGQIISVVVEESSYGFHYIGLDDRHGDKRSKRDCAYEIGIDKDGKIFTATLEGRQLTETRTLGTSYGLDQLIRAWYACGTKIILDEDDVVTSEGDY